MKPPAWVVPTFFILACPVWAQFGTNQTLFRNHVATLTGTLDVHGVGSGTVSGPAGSSAVYKTDQHISGVLKLDQYNLLTGALTGTLDGTITISETSDVSSACTVHNTFAAGTSAQSDFQGQPLRFNLSFDIGSDTWSLWPSNDSVNGVETSVQTCAGQSSTSSATVPMAFMPINMTMRFPFATSGFDLAGTHVVNCDGCGNADSNPVAYTFTYNLKANLQDCTYGLAAASAHLGVGATSGSIAITAAAGCPWVALPHDPWIAILSGASGSGSGSATFSAAANTTGATRSGTITVGGLTFTVTQEAGGGQFFPVTPCRIADTRNPDGPFGGPLIPAGSSRSFPVPQSPCNIPRNAIAYSINVTVIPRGKLGYLTLSPTGDPLPLVSTLNDLTGKIVANAALAPAGAGGAIDVFVTDATDVVIDINGYFAPPDTPGGLLFYPVTPCRISDTRNASGEFGGPALPAGGVRTYTIAGSVCGIPATAQAFSLNASVVPKGPLGYLTLWPAGQPQPLVATLNSLDGSIVANAAIVPASSSGAISAFVTDATDLILDIDGYFAPPATGGLSFYPVSPCRITDTRESAGTFGGPIMAASSVRSFPIPASSCGVASNAKAYSLNVSVVPVVALGYLTLWPTGSAQPLVSTLNSLKGEILANAALVGSGSSGAVSVFVTDRTHVILDINGLFAP
jgi:Putative binding domain, N-terminal